MSSIPAVEAAAKAYADAYDHLRDQVNQAQANGVPDAAIARAAGVSRITIQKWTGKDKNWKSHKTNNA